MAMPSAAVVERFDIIEDVGLGQISGFVEAFLYVFFLQAREERFDHRIIPTVATPAHTGLEVVGDAEASPVVAAELGALIGVHEYTTLRFSPPDRH